MCIDRIAYVVYEDIPDDAQGTWVFSKERFVYQGKTHLGTIAIGPCEDGAWRFTPETVAGIEVYRAHLLARDVVEGVVALETWETQLVKRHPWLGERMFLMNNGQWILLVLIVLLAVIVERVVNAMVRALVLAWYSRNQAALSDGDERSLRMPFRIVSYAAVFYLGIHLMRPSSEWMVLLVRVSFVSMAIGIVWAALNVINVVASYFLQVAKRTENRFDDLLVPLIHKTAKVLVTLVGILFVAQSMGSDLTALLTGLGIGGLAVALAAKDTLANVFGSMTVLMDRPFQIGDWICTGDVEGSVEEVGFRSTRVRTFYDSVITVPNSNLTNREIDNYGRRRYRRFTTKIGITYDTPPDRIEAFCEAVRQLILAHRWTRKDYFHVYLNGLGSSSLEILLYVFWQVPDWNKELAEKHRLLVDILRIGHELGVSFAFPTQTLHVQQESHHEYDALPDESAAVAQSVAMAISTHPISAAEPRSVSKDGKLPEFVKGL